MLKKMSLVSIVIAVLLTASVAFALDWSDPTKDYYIGFNNMWGGQPYSTAIGEITLENAGYADVNEFGYYAMDDRSVLHPIFVGTDSVGKTVEFPQLTENFAFYLKNNDGTWFSWRNDTDPNPYDQHFILAWESGDVAYIAMEDLVLENSDKDYNDMIVKIDFTGTPVATPEPATLLLLGLGLLGIVPLRKKMK